MNLLIPQNIVPMVFVFIDNCSEDDSLEQLKNNDVTIIQSKLPYSKYKWAFKQFLVHDFGICFKFIFLVSIFSSCFWFMF